MKTFVVASVAYWKRTKICPIWEKNNNSIPVHVWLSLDQYITVEKAKIKNNFKNAVQYTAVSSKDRTVMSWKKKKQVYFLNYQTSICVISIWRRFISLENRRYSFKINTHEFTASKFGPFNLLNCTILPFYGNGNYITLMDLQVKPLKILEIDCTRFKQFTLQNICPFK